jgi:hypothetical protein
MPFSYKKNLFFLIGALLTTYSPPKKPQLWAFFRAARALADNGA